MSKKKHLIKAAAAILAVALLWTVGSVQLSRRSEQKQNEDFVCVLDVGQGDSIIVNSNGRTALIDTGKEIYGYEIIKKLRSYGIDNIDVMILTHPHDDHIGSADYIIENFGVDNIIYSSLLTESKTSADCVKELGTAIEENNINVYSAISGMVVNIGDFEITVLMNDTDAKEENDRSIVLMAEIFGNKFLFTGDAESAAENALIDNDINFDCDVLKVGHHGSKSSSTDEFLKIASPQYAAISVGDNSYGHPNNDVIKRLGDLGSEVLRTDIHGDIYFAIENEKIVYINE